MSWWRWALLVLVLGGMLVLSPTDERAREWMVRGDRAHGERAYTEALTYYRSAAERLPHAAAPWVRMGEVLLAQGRREEAWNATWEALVRRGGALEARALLAQSYTAWGLYRNAAQEWEALVALRPTRADLWLDLGEARAALGDFQSSQAAFEMVLRLDDGENRQRAAYQLGRLALLEGDRTRAQGAFQQAQDGPSTTLARHAQILAEALKQATQAESPKEADISLGQALLRSGEFELARQYFSHAEELDPEDGVVAAYLGYIYVYLGDGERAEIYGHRAEALNPDHPMVAYLRGLSEARLGHWHTAAEAFHRAWQLDPTNPAVALELARSLLSLDPPDYLGAAQWYDLAVQLDPENPDFLIAEARFYVDRLIDPSRKGRELSLQAVDLAPDRAEAYTVLGWSYYLSGALDQARYTLEHARTLAPDDPEIRYKLGVTYARLGRYADARRELQLAVDWDWHGKWGERARGALSWLERRG